MQIAHNKLLPIVVVTVLVGAGALLMLRAGDDRVPAGAPMEEVPLPATTPGADADTPTETLNTVVGGFRRVEQEMAALRDANEQLRREAREARDMENRLRADLERAVGQATSRLQAENAAERQRLEASARPSRSRVAAGASDAIGFDDRGLEGSLPVGGGVAHPAGGASPMASVSPSTGRMVLPAGYRMGIGADGREGVMRAVAAPPAPPPVRPSGPPPATPYYTIPENATLTGATAMTALVGRVPIDGRVTDPMQFKVLLGPENLAANGHYLPPNLAGIVVSGIAVGDMTLSCSEGFIQSLTFVFADGAIQTVSKRKGGAATKSVGRGGTDERLGYLSDAYGNPCVRGEFVTNAPAYLTDLVGLKALSLAGEAAAAAQTTTSTSALTGGTTSTVTGDTGRYVLGKAVSGGVDEVTSWILRRLDNSFDAVVVRAGVEIVVHIEEEIPLDKQAEPRLIDYGRPDLATSTPHGDHYHGLH